MNGKQGHIWTHALQIARMIMQKLLIHMCTWEGACAPEPIQWIILLTRGARSKQQSISTQSFFGYVAISTNWGPFSGCPYHKNPTILGSIVVAWLLSPPLAAGNRLRRLWPLPSHWPGQGEAQGVLPQLGWGFPYRKMLGP